MGSHSVTCHATQVNAPALTLASKLVSIYLPRKDGRLSWPRLPGCAPAGSRTCDLSITSPTPYHYTTEPPTTVLRSVAKFPRYLHARTHAVPTKRHPSTHPAGEFTAERATERISTIGQYLMHRWQKIWRFIFIPACTRKIKLSSTYPDTGWFSIFSQVGQTLRQYTAFGHLDVWTLNNLHVYNSTLVQVKIETRIPLGMHRLLFLYQLDSFAFQTVTLWYDNVSHTGTLKNLAHRTWPKQKIDVKTNFNKWPAVAAQTARSRCKVLHTVRLLF